MVVALSLVEDSIVRVLYPSSSEVSTVQQPFPLLEPVVVQVELFAF